MYINGVILDADEANDDFVGNVREQNRVIAGAHRKVVGQNFLVHEVILGEEFDFLTVRKFGDHDDGALVDAGEKHRIIFGAADAKLKAIDGIK